MGTKSLDSAENIVFYHRTLNHVADACDVCAGIDDADIVGIDILYYQPRLETIRQPFGLTCQFSTISISETM